MEGEPGAAEKPSKPAPQSLGELLKRLVEDTGRLFRSELRLAQAELTANVAKALRPLGLVMAGGLLMLGGLFTLLGAFVAWLTPLIGAALAALVVAMVATAAGGGLAFAGWKQMGRIGFLPTRVAKALKDDVAVFKGHDDD